MLSVACTPDGNWVVSGSKDRGVQFWDPRTGQTQFMLQGHKNSGNIRVFVRVEGGGMLTDPFFSVSDLCCCKSERAAPLRHWIWR